MEAWSELSCCKPSLGEKHTTLPLLRALFKTFFYFEASFAAVIASIFAVSSWRAIASHDSLQIREDLPFFLQAGTIFAIHAIAIWHVSEASRWARVSGVAASVVNILIVLQSLPFRSSSDKPLALDMVVFGIAGIAVFSIRLEPLSASETLPSGPPTLW